MLTSYLPPPPHTHTYTGSVQCSLFCGGQSCKYESPLQWRSEDMALRGLYSHWVTDNVLAMARPSTLLFRIYDIIGQFKRCVCVKVCVVILCKICSQY